MRKNSSSTQSEKQSCKEKKGPRIFELRGTSSTMPENRSMNIFWQARPLHQPFFYPANLRID